MFPVFPGEKSKKNISKVCQLKFYSLCRTFKSDKWTYVRKLSKIRLLLRKELGSRVRLNILSDKSSQMRREAIMFISELFPLQTYSFPI